MTNSDDRVIFISKTLP